MNSFLEKFLLNNKIDFKQNVSLSKYTYFKTGKMAKFIVLPDTIEGFKKFIRFFYEK